MRRFPISILVIGLALAFTGPTPAQDNVRLTGSGATFPFPIYSTWFKSFSGKSRASRWTTRDKGSGAGIQDFLNARWTSRRATPR